MNKLKLDPDQLCAESFSLGEDAALLRGTVQAQSFVSDMVPSGYCGGEKSMYCVETDFAWQTCGTSCHFHCIPTGNEPSCTGC